MKGQLHLYQRLLGYLKPYRTQVVIAYSSMLVAALLNLLVPQIIKEVIDSGLDNKEITTLLTAAGLILGIAIVRGAAAFGQRYYGLWLTHRVSYDLRSDFYRSVQGQSFSFHDQAQTGDLMSRATSDTAETERFVGVGLMDLLSTLILIFGVIIALFNEDRWLATLAFGPLFILLIIVMRYGVFIRPKFKLVQEQMGELSSTMQESMTGIGVVKAFAREPYELEKFDQENERWFDLRYKIIRIWANNWTLFTFIVGISVFLLLWFGGPLVLSEALTVGTLFAMISYVLMLNGPVQRLGFMVNMAASAGASVSRIFEIIDTRVDIQEKPNAIAFHSPAAYVPSSGHQAERIQGQVEFEQVSFSYPGDGPNVLHDINFSVASGQTIALIGPTGAGKSTIISLLPRFYDVTTGRILIDGHDVRDAKIRSLRQQFAIVLQNPFLFSTTIAENITYGRPDASHEEIIAAAKAASAHNFIMHFPNGYDTLVGERGVTLSGGQKQRVAIARALLCNPSILILDDATSSVDTETEHQIQQALTRLMHGRTTFIIAQRLLTLKNADAIFVLDQGRIVERGTHTELLAEDGLYREIYELQLKDQEDFRQWVIG